MNILYDDERVICSDEAVIIKHFYFPIDTHKEIPYSQIRSIKIKKIRVKQWN